MTVWLSFQRDYSIDAYPTTDAAGSPGGWPPGGLKVFVRERSNADRLPYSEVGAVKRELINLESQVESSPHR